MAVALLAACADSLPRADRRHHRCRSAVAPVDAAAGRRAGGHDRAARRRDADCDREASLRARSAARTGCHAARVDDGGDRRAWPARRRRRPEHVPVRLSGTLPPGSWRASTSTSPARSRARIFGDPDRIDLRVVEASQRESALQSGQVDLVVRTFSITCARKKNVAFSTVYFNANQRILALKGSGIDSAADAFR